MFVTAYREGPVPAVTGGFNEPTCQKCHFDNLLNDRNGSLRVQGVPSRYEPGREYTFTIVLRRGGLTRGGFEMSSRFAPESLDGQAGQQAGRFRMPDADADLQVITEPDKTVEYVQHTRAGSLATKVGEQRWKVVWIAPAAAAGPVQFNIAANVANDDASPLGDFIYTQEIVSRAR